MQEMCSFINKQKGIEVSFLSIPRKEEGKVGYEEVIQE